MTIDTSIGLDDPREQESGIDDEARARKAREDGESVEDDKPRPDLTREDIEAGNDRNASADQGNRSGTTNKLRDDGIEFG
jgi:hypothetical protein